MDEADKQPLVPTGMFVLVVPQIVAAYQMLAKALVKWEDHPTPVGAEKSLTGKTLCVIDSDVPGFSSHAAL